MSTDTAEQINEKLLVQFLGDAKALVVDTAPSTRASLANILVGMGVKSNKVLLSSSFEDAVEVIRTNKPKLIMCDFNLGKHCGIDLIEIQRSDGKNTVVDKSGLFILVTANSSEAAIAQAAEEDVDSYILKPYSIDSLKRSLIHAVESKVKPSDYILSIERGKEKLTTGQYDEALTCFTTAMKHDPKPSLACFYIGHANRLNQKYDEAERGYNKGLTFNRIHYKCLVGLYELYTLRQMYPEAYTLISEMLQTYPINPRRLSDVLKLSLLTKNYDDIDSFYEAFKNFDERDENLIKHICAGLVVCGKHFLLKKRKDKGIDLFQKATITAAGRSNFIKEVILILLDENLHADAAEFLKRFDPALHTTPEYLSLEYRVYEKILPRHTIVITGRKLLKQGVHDPSVYEILIRHTREAGYADSAESLAHDAAQRWPERKAEFLKLVQN